MRKDGAMRVALPIGLVLITMVGACESADRNVAPWLSRRIAARYGAEHRVHPDLPHWIVAESALDEVAGGVLEWLERTVG